MNLQSVKISLQIYQMAMTLNRRYFFNLSNDDNFKKVISLYRLYQSKPLTQWEVSARSGSFCLPVLVIIIVIETSRMGMLMRQFWTCSERIKWKCIFRLPVQEVCMLNALKRGWNTLKNKTMQWETFKLWYLSESKKN